MWFCEECLKKGCYMDWIDEIRGRGEGSVTITIVEDGQDWPMCECDCHD